MSNALRVVHDFAVSRPVSHFSQLRVGQLYARRPPRREVPRPGHPDPKDQLVVPFRVGELVLRLKGCPI